MIYNHAPDWVYAIKTLGSTAKLVFERMFSLSKDGTQPVYIKRQDMADWLGVSLPAITRSFKELANLGLIEEIPSDNKWNNIKNFVINASDKQAQNVTIDSNKTLQGSNKTLLSQTQNVTACSNEMLLSSLDRNIERNSKKEREAKRSVSALSSYSSYEDFIPLFTQLAEQFKDEHLAIGRMYLPTVVKKFFNHYQARKFRWKHGVNADATEWLLNECTHIEGNLLRDPESEARMEQQQRAEATNKWVKEEAEKTGKTEKQVVDDFTRQMRICKYGPTEEQKLISEGLGISVLEIMPKEQREAYLNACK